MSPVKRRKQPTERLLSPTGSQHGGQESPHKPAGTTHLIHFFFALKVLLTGNNKSFFWLLSVGSPRRSFRNSPAKPSVVTSSFYGKQKSVYLTPLERKAVKESLPFRLSVLPSPPQAAKKTDEKMKKAAKRGNKPRKSSVGSSKRAKKETRSSQSPVKKIQLTRCNTRFVSDF